MGKAKIGITLDEGYVEQIDRLVSERVFKNRSQAVQEAVSDKLRRMKRSRLRRNAQNSIQLLKRQWPRRLERGYKRMA